MTPLFPQRHRARLLKNMLSQTAAAFTCSVSQLLFSRKLKTNPHYIQKQGIV